MTETEYLESEQTSDTKHEYIDGQTYAMAGAGSNHNRIAVNVAGEFRNHLKGTPCETFMADMKVRLGHDYVYPDVMVDCNPQKTDNYFADSPVVIVEVLSKSTRKTDTTVKLIRYINLPSLQEYVLIEQDIVSVQVLRKSNDWKTEYYYLGDMVSFSSIGLSLAVEEIYDRVENGEMTLKIELTNCFNDVKNSLNAAMQYYQIWFSLCGEGKAIKEYIKELNDYRYVDFFNATWSGGYKLMFIEISCIFDSDTKTNNYRKLTKLMIDNEFHLLAKKLKDDLCQFKNLISNIKTIVTVQTPIKKPEKILHKNK